MGGDTLTLTTGGLTLLGVLSSIGVTVAFGIEGAWWVRVAVGLGVAFALIVLVKLTTRSGTGPLARLARWAISSADERSGKH